MKKRIEYIDIARGIAMILIVLGHTLVHSEHCSVIFKFLYSFHVMFFLFLSGFVFKLNKNENYKDFIIKRFKRIIIPYFVWSIIFLVPYSLMGQNINETFDTNGIFDLRKMIINVFYGIGKDGRLKQNSSLWFLPALFSIELFYYWIIRLSEKNKSLKFAFIPLLLIIGFFSCNYLNLSLPFGINTLLEIGIFFYIGYLSKDLINSRVFNNFYINFLLFILGVFCFKFNSLVMCIDYRYGNYFLMIISALSFTINFVYISMKIRKNTILQFIGRNTMGILIFHKLIVLIFQTKLGFISKMLINSNFFVEVLISSFVVVISIFISIFISYIVKKFFPILVGENKK